MLDRAETRRGGFDRILEPASYSPTRDELQLGRDALEAVLDGFPKARVVAVGKVAERTLAALGRTPDATLRHPSMGGATEFRAGLTALAADLKRRPGRP